MQHLNVEKLSGSIGGLVLDFDLHNLSDDNFDLVARAFWEHQVLVFKGQSLPIEEHIEFGKRFGSLHTHPSSKGVEGHPEVLHLLNKGKSKTITEVWHSDVSCDEQPPAISILQCIQAPAYGGDTLFASQYGALDLLSPAMREMIEPLSAVHANFGMEATHPVIRTHPETGKPALYVNRGFTKHFEGMTAAESTPLLDYLVDIGSSPELTMRHSWSIGDIVMWDNRCVMHYAIHDYGDAPREMHRVTIAGTRPQ